MAENDASIVVRARTAWAGPVPKGTVLRVTDVAGQQVGDLVIFRADDVTERFSQANTRKLENTLYVHEGSRLWSTKCTVLAQIERDTVNRHYILSSACSPYDYPIRFGVTDHPSCLDNLRTALKQFGARRIPRSGTPVATSNLIAVPCRTAATCAPRPARSSH